MHSGPMSGAGPGEKGIAPWEGSFRNLAGWWAHTTAPQVWVASEYDRGSGRLRFWCDSDSELTKGLGAVLVEGLSGLTPQEVLQVSRVARGACVCACAY